MGTFSYKAIGTRQYEDPTRNSSSSTALYGAKADVHGWTSGDAQKRDVTTSCLSQQEKFGRNWQKVHEDLQ